MARGQHGGHRGCLLLAVDRGPRWPAVGIPAMPHPVLPIPETIAASPVLVIATEADPATPYYGGVALARALSPSANLLTVSGGGHTAFERSPCVAEHVNLYFVELRAPGGHAC